MFLNDQQTQEFKAKGFIVLKGFFDATVMDQVSAWLDELSLKHPKPHDEAKYYEKSTITGENILIRIENVLGGHNREMTRVLLPPKAIGSRSFAPASVRLL